MTLPLGVLKRGNVEFQPQLPDTKKNAISRLGVGTFNKVYLGFENTFWPEQTSWIQYMGPNSSEWPMFFSLKKYTGKSVLVAFNVGSFAEKLEGKTDSETVSSAMKVLRLISNQNGWRLSDPTAFRVTRWGGDPYARGSYSYVPVGASLSDFDSIGSQINSRLFFAGEATSSSHYMTAHAAYLSGLRAANQIIVDDEHTPDVTEAG